MRRGWVAIVVLAGCRISDLSFHRPPDDAVIGAGDDADSGAGGAGMEAGNDAVVDVAAPVDAAAGSAFASCVNLQARCGIAGEGCCDSPLVTGGTFFRDFDRAGDAQSGTATAPATISSFRLDKFDVTVARFRAFVNAGMGTRSHPPDTGAGAHPNHPETGWDASWTANLEASTTALTTGINCSSDQTWHDVPLSPEDENRPMNCITWYEAMAFCIWDGGYLPTEAEWTYAAMGGDQQRAYPWSSSTAPLMIDASHASYNPDGGSGTSCTGDPAPGCGPTDIVPVGTLPAGDGRWGQSDLVGNLSQWTLDWFLPYSEPCTDCASTVLPSGNPVIRSVRGGAFVYAADHLRGGFRSNEGPTQRNYIDGIRCARPM
jgi:formylglycine-generating enzyme